MKYSELAHVYGQLEKTAKKLEKRDILAEFYKKTRKDELRTVVLLSMGIVFPAGEQELGVSREILKRVILKTYGVQERELTKKFKETGDLGLVAEHFAKNKKQRSLLKKELTTGKVFDNLSKLPEMTGSGSLERKISLVSELLASSEPREACYIIRAVTGGMRIGVAEGIVRDALALAFGKEPAKLEKIYDIVGDYGTVAEMASAGKLNATVTVGRPLRVMLAERAADLKEALENFEKPALQYKYDGFRVACHKNGSHIRIFSRRLEDVTKQFPDIVDMVKENIKAKQCIIEGEALAIDAHTRAPLPFQVLSRRIQRKYDIEKTVKEIPVQVNLFELLYLDGISLMEEPFEKRWNALKKIVRENANFRLADHIETKDFNEADKFYKSALAAGQEGIIVKNLEARYQPGKRVGFWLKVKEILEPLDLVIVGAEWGEGKRANWLGSLILAARSGNKFVETGRMASGLTESQMDSLTKLLKKIITGEEGKTVKVRPEIVIEVGYEEIQRSPKYESGFALRFPKLLRIREPSDKGPMDANTTKDIERLFAQQKKRK